MSVFIDRDLELSRPVVHSGPSGLSMRPVWSATRAPLRRRLVSEEGLLGQAARYSISAGANWVPEQSRLRSGPPFAPSQTVFLVRVLDVATAVSGRLQLRRELETGRGPLVIECSAVWFIDAAWLGVLVSTARYGAQLGRKVTVVAPSPRVLRVLRLVGLEWLIGQE
jgi:anti-anti-sigma factor